MNWLRNLLHRRPTYVIRVRSRLTHKVVLRYRLTKRDKVEWSRGWGHATVRVVTPDKVFRLVKPRDFLELYRNRVLILSLPIRMLQYEAAKRVFTIRAYEQ